MNDIDVLKIIEAYKKVKGECPDYVAHGIAESVADFKKKGLWDQIYTLRPWLHGVIQKDSVTGEMETVLDDNGLGIIDWKNPFNEGRKYNFFQEPANALVTDPRSTTEVEVATGVWKIEDAMKISKALNNSGTRTAIIFPPKPSGTDE